jgi:hypothetical protein
MWSELIPKEKILIWDLLLYFYVGFFF